jgi:hypothetical protein
VPTKLSSETQAPARPAMTLGNMRQLGVIKIIRAKREG